MTATRIAARLAILALLAACDPGGIPGPPEGFEHALATNTCGPADGPAVAVYLSGTPSDTVEPATPFVRVVVWGPLASLPGRTFDLLPGAGEGGAWLVTGPGEFEIATSGTVRVLAVRGDSTVAGALDVRFEVTGRVTGGFTASWRSRSLLCG